MGAMMNSLRLRFLEGLRCVVPVVTLAIGFLLIGYVGRAQAASSPQDLVSTRQLAVENMPECQASDARVVNYKSVHFLGSDFVFQNRDAAKNSQPACRGRSIGFRRYLTRNGKWASEVERQVRSADTRDDVEVFAHIFLLRVADRSMRAAAPRISQVGVPHRFPGVVFTKWTSSKHGAAEGVGRVESKVEAYEWTIDNTVDDETGQPISVSCVARSDQSQQKDSQYLEAGRPFDDPKIRSTGPCSAWFAIDIGASGRAFVRIAFGGKVFRAAEAVKFLRTELQNGARE